MAKTKDQAKGKTQKKAAAAEEKAPMLIKTELIRDIAEETDLNISDVEKVFASFERRTGEFLYKNRDNKKAKVQLMGFLSMNAGFVAGRTGRNPQDPDEEIEIPDGYRVYASAGQKLKDVVNGVVKEKSKGSNKKGDKKADKKADVKSGKDKKKGKK